MAGKIVSAKDAKICIEEHEKLLAQLEDISKRENESVEAIVKASDDLMNGEINKILKNLSVDELNRNKNGFRIKTLKDSGYNTIYDILNSSSFSLSRINGISEEAAYAIYSVAESFRREAKKGDSSFLVGKIDFHPHGTHLFHGPLDNEPLPA